MKAVVALSVAIAVGAAAFASAKPVTVCAENLGTVPVQVSCGETRLDVTLGGGLQPVRLPKVDPAPVEMALKGGLRNTDDSRPPALREVSIGLDRAGAIDTEGLPACGKKRIEGLATGAARRRCRDAIVGDGTAFVLLADGQQVGVPLSLFNGGNRQGTTRVLIHAGLVTPLVAVLSIETATRGKYGLEGFLRMPPALEEGGATLLEYQVHVGRRFFNGGAEKSYASSSCPAGTLSAQVRYAFADGRRMIGTASTPCTPRD